MKKNYHKPNSGKDPRNKKVTPPPPTEQKSKPGIWQLPKSIYTIIGGIGGFILLVLGLNNEWFQCRSNYRSDHEKHQDYTWIHGITAPYELRSKDTFMINYGGVSHGLINRKKDKGLPPTFTDVFGRVDRPADRTIEENLVITVSVKDDKFWITLKIRDLKTREVIAEIVENKWRLKPNADDFYDGEEAFEILDKNNYPALSIWYEKGEFQIRGYFVGTTSTMFLFDNRNPRFVDKTDPQYEMKAEHYASLLPRRKIKPLTKPAFNDFHAK